MSDADVLKSLVRRKLAGFMRRYNYVVMRLRKFAPDVPLQDLSGFELLRLAHEMCRERDWPTYRRALNDLLREAGNPERLPDLASLYLPKEK
jgi:hypothetical protein